jgi:hypothetical protein
MPTSPLRWVNLEFWGPVWPNLVASAICSVLVWAKLHFEQIGRRRALERRITHTNRDRPGGEADAC